MDHGFRTLKQLSEEHHGASYQKVHRGVTALREAGLVSPWHGENNELRLTLDDGLRVKRFLSFLENGETVKSALPKLESDILQRRIEDLEKENEHLRALVEWKPSWWVRTLRWIIPRRSRLGTAIWNRTAPEARAG